MVQTWKSGPATVEVCEEGDEPFGQCSIAGCDGPSIWRSSMMGMRCQEHAGKQGLIEGQHNG